MLFNATIRIPVKGGDELNPHFREEVRQWSVADRAEFEAHGTVRGRRVELPEWDGVERFQGLTEMSQRAYDLGFRV